MTMRTRLRGAVGGGSAGLCTYEALYLQMCAAEKRRARSPAWFPRAPPLTLVQTDGINRYIFTPLPLMNPASTDMLSVGWNNIFFFGFHSVKRHSITPEADSCLKRREALNLSRQSLLGSLGVHITLLDRIQRLILLLPTCVILIALWAPLMQLSLVSSAAAHKNADYTAIRLVDYMIFN